MEDYPEYLKAPPFCEMSEQAVIGGILIDAEIMGDMEDLSVDHFYQSKNKLIFSSMQELIANGSKPDIVTVSSYLNAQGALDGVGGHAYLATIANAVPSLSNMNSYANIIIDKWIERELLKSSNEIATLAYDSIPTEDKLAAAQKSVMALNSNNSAEARQINSALRKCVAGIDERYNSDGRIVGLSTGFIDIDIRTQGLADGNLIIVAGRPGMGKTTFAMNIAEKTAMEGGAVIVFSMEMPEQDLVDRMISSTGNIPLSRVRSGKLREEEWPKLSSGLSKLKDIPLYIDDRGELTPNQMRSAARKLHRKNPIRLIIVDYIQLARFPKADTREQEVSEISRSLKGMAKEFGCPVIGIAQLNRECDKRPNPFKRPVLSDLRDSGSLEQDADIILFCYRDVVYNEHTNSPNVVEIICGKFRNGVIGTDYLRSNLAYNRFENLAKPHQVPPPPVPDDFDYGEDKK